MENFLQPRCMIRYILSHFLKAHIKIFSNDDRFDIKILKFSSPMQKGCPGKVKEVFFVQNNWFANLFLDVHMCKWLYKDALQKQIEENHFLKIWPGKPGNLSRFCFGKVLTTLNFDIHYDPESPFVTYRGPFLVPFSKKSVPFLAPLWDV